MRRMVSLALAAAIAPLAALWLSFAPALAGGDATPVDVVRQLYAERLPEASILHTRRLRALFATDGRPQSGGNLTFDYRVNHEPISRNVTGDLSFVETRIGPAKAEVDVSLVDDRPQRLVYTVVIEEGSWRIDEVRSMGEPSWVLSDLFRGETH